MTLSSFLFVLIGGVLAAALGWAIGSFGPNNLQSLSRATAGSDNGPRFDLSRLRSRKLSDISDDTMGLVLVLSVVVSVILIAHFAGQH
jgi:hypothetical protein